MKRHNNLFVSLIIILILLTVNINVYGINTSKKTIVNDNKEFYLGYVNIYGDGNSSELEAVAQNDLTFKIPSETEKVDFYIDYNMHCEGSIDTGTVILILSVNGQNTTPLLKTTFFNEDGRLVAENISVSRKDLIVFYLQAIYVSGLYNNETKAVGAGTVPHGKQILVKNDVFNAQLGRRSSDEPFVYLEGNFQYRNRVGISRGLATIHGREGRYIFGIWGNHFRLIIPLNGERIGIIGRITYERDQQTFNGVWLLRGLNSNGWISGTIT